MSSRTRTSATGRGHHAGAEGERSAAGVSGEGDVMPPPSSGETDGGGGGGAGEWLFKQDDVVLGPVKAESLVEKLRSGEMSIDTPVARDGQPFKPMKLIAFFREAHDEYLWRQREEAEERAHAAAVLKAKVLRVFLVALILLIPSAAGAFAGRIVMVLQPWDKTAEWIARAPPIVDLAPRALPPPRVAVIAPTPAPTPTPDSVEDESKSDAAADERDERRARRERGDRRGRKETRERRRPERGTAPAADRAQPTAAGADTGKADTARADTAKAEPEGRGSERGYVKELTNEQAIAPLKEVKSALGACFKTELAANPDMPSQLNLAYTVTEQGRAANVEVTNRELRGSAIQGCVKEALSTARWPRFEGERKNVSVPFNIRKPPKPSTTPAAGTSK